MKKRILKWTVGILLAPIVLFFILAALLYVPAIQDFAVRKATAYAAEATGMDVRIGLLRLTFLFDINLQEVQVTDKEEDTLLDVEQLTVDLSFPNRLSRVWPYADTSAISTWTPTASSSRRKPSP